MDRRGFTRIKIQGAKIQYRRESVRGLWGVLSKPAEVQDISKSGLAFITNELLEHGDKIVMKINFPDGKHLKLKGQIRWNQQHSSSDSFYLGVQFAPFGYRHDYNSMSAWEYLRSMEGQSIIKPENN